MIDERHGISCPHCGRGMYRVFGVWECKNCGYRSVCAVCGINPVHPHRKWAICLDCLTDMLIEADVIELNTRYKRRFGVIQ